MAYAVIRAYFAVQWLSAGPIAHSLPELQHELTQAAQGHAALVHFWASWCEACVTELPAIEKLSVQLRSRGVPLIFVSLDSPEDADKANALLAKTGLAGNPSILLDAPDPEAITPAFDVRGKRRWQAQLPATFLRLESGAIAAAYLGETPTRRILEDLRRPDKGSPK